MRQLWTRTQNLAPAISLVLLAGLWIAGGFVTASSKLSESYLADVRTASEAVPMRIGDWLGREAEPLAAAIEMLKPNTILQRDYFNPQSGETVVMLFVHCTDVRDMHGHFPPVCYPSHGWLAVSNEPVEFLINDRAFTGRIYGYRWPDEKQRSSIQVLNFFMGPGDEIHVAPDLNSLRTTLARRDFASIGSAQFQLLMPASFSPSERQEVIDQFLPALAPLIEAVSQDPRLIVAEGKENP